MKISFDLTSARSLLISLRAVAISAFLCVTVAMLFPKAQGFLAVGCISLTGTLAIQLFRLKSVEEKPDPRDRDMGGLGLKAPR